MSKIWLDGKFYSRRDPRAKFNVLTHANHYGTSVFDGLKFYETARGPAVFRLMEHVVRLLRSAASLHMTHEWAVEQICAAILATVKRSRLKSGYVRPLMFYGESNLKLNPSSAGAAVHLAIIVEPWGKYLGDKGLRLKVSDVRRLPPNSFDVHAKIGGHYINSILAQRQAQAEGYDDAVLLLQDSTIGEASVANIFFVKDRCLYTSMPHEILPGITRDSVMALARHLGYGIEEKPIYLPQSFYEECFITGTAVEIARVARIDIPSVIENQARIKTVSFGEAPGPIVLQLQEFFDRVIHGQEPKFEDWLTYVE